MLKKNRRPVLIFVLIFLILILSAVAAGLLWCYPDNPELYSGSVSPPSPVGTWVIADDWESGSSPDDIIVTFTDSGIMTISSGSFSALYFYDNDTLQIFDIEIDQSFPFFTDTPPVGADFKCIITGDHMHLQGSFHILPGPHGHADLIRVSELTNLSADELAALY